MPVAGSRSAKCGDKPRESQRDRPADGCGLANSFTLSLLSFVNAMTRRSTVLVLGTRALTALATVWCLGCSAFDPMLDALVGSRGMAGMDCAREMGSPLTSDRGVAAVAPSPDGSGHIGYTCDCGGCFSASPHSAVLAMSTHTIPSPEPQVFARLLSVTRAPVAPPPELRTL